MRCGWHFVHWVEELRAPKRLSFDLAGELQIVSLLCSCDSR